ATIQGWAANPNTPSGIKLGVDNRQVTNLVNAIDVKHLVNDKNWEITGLIAGCDTWNDESTFETQWLVANDGTITVPTVGAGYNYDILWTNLSNPSVPASADRGVTNSYTISGLNEGDTIEISISGDFPRIYFNNSGDKDKIIAVTQWGDIEWTSMNNAFAGATNLEVTAKDTPDLSNVEDMFYMFKGAETLTGSQGNWNWNTENVTNMSAAFFQASNFNGDISGWNTENVTNMASMFAQATSFNQDIGNWNTGKVTNMKTLFKDANSFDQDLGSWNLKSLTNAQGMFNVNSESYGLNCDMFSATLEGWAANSNTPSGIVLGSVNKVADANAFANSILSLGAMGWTFPGLSTMPCDDVVATSGNIDDLVEVNSDLTMTLYPNPTDGVFTLSTETGTSYMVLDIYGRTILNGQVINTKAVVDLTSYPRGIYYVKVGEKVERIVVK
ncbi:MAG TPA: BspA family leucine-rich repeat surface protein, partial [Erysipelothrix sp.]|nr:BspA family leucine-rich repeat surface protein [Erysipelothrix sp.]